jgi:hypothetical protein
MKKMFFRILSIEPNLEDRSQKPLLFHGLQSLAWKVLASVLA